MKKRMLSLLLTLVMVLGCISVPAAATESAPKSLKVLTIGNSYSIDVKAYLADIFKAEGDDIQLTLGTLYVSGQGITGHWSFAKNDKKYIYYKNTTGKWQTLADITIKDALKDEQWDYIVLQQSGDAAGRASSFSDLDNLIGYVNQHKANPNAKLLWHMTWAVQSTHNSAGFLSNYNRDQQFYFDCVANTTRDHLMTNPAFSGMIPVGAAIQNARTATSIGDNLNRDGYHLNTLGRVISGYTWYCMLTGKTLDTIHYTDVRAESATPAMTLTEEEAKAVVQAVNAAMADPYAGTRSFYELQAGDVFYFSYPPTENRPSIGYVFGSDTVADGTQVLVTVPKGTVAEETNLYAAQFWYEDNGVLVNVSGTDKCKNQFGLHDIITAVDGSTVTLDDGTHKDPSTCTLGQTSGNCGSADRATECAAKLTLSDKVAIVDLRAAVLAGTETAAADVAAVKALCDEGKAVVNTYAPNGTACAFVVQDHTLKITAEQPAEVALNVSTEDGWADENSVAYGNVGFRASFGLAENPDYKISQRKLDGQETKDTSFFVNGNHTVSATVKKIFQGDVFFFIEAPTGGQECEAIVLHSNTLPLGISKVVPPNGNGAKYGALHFWEIMEAETSPLKRMPGMWVSYTNRYRYGIHDVISIYDPEGNAVTVSTPKDSHFSKNSCNYTKAAGFDRPGYYEERCGDLVERGYECPSYLKLADGLKIYDLRGEVRAGLIPAATDVPTLKTLCDQGKILINTFTLDGTKSGDGTASAFIVIDAQPFVTRGEVMQALYEQAGSPAITTQTTFADVTADNPYANAVAWAVQTGLVAGYGDGNFGIGDNMTVEQLAVILWKQAGKSAATTATTLQCNSWAAEALGWCAANNILNKVTPATANQDATRTEVFQMLANSLNR